MSELTTVNDLSTFPIDDHSSLNFECPNSTRELGNVQLTALTAIPHGFSADVERFEMTTPTAPKLVSKYLHLELHRLLNQVETSEQLLNVVHSK
jgi:hypothetical protein